MYSNNVHGQQKTIKLKGKKLTQKNKEKKMNSQREKVTNYWREKICVFNFLYYNTCALWREARPVQSRELFVSFVFKERKRILAWWCTHNANRQESVCGTTDRSK